MPQFAKNCLLCLKEVNYLEVGDTGGGGRSSERILGRQVCHPFSTLFELVQHYPTFVGSRGHENIIQGHEEEGACALCYKCEALSEDVTAVVGQITALQAILRGMMGIIRGRILDSERQTRDDTEEQDQRLERLRQSLLCLSDETDNFPQVDVKEEEDNYQKVEEDEFFDVLKSNSDGNDEEGDSDCSLFITPHKTNSNRNACVSRRRSKRQIVTRHNSYENDTCSTSDFDQEKSENDTSDNKDHTMDETNSTSLKCHSCVQHFASETLLYNHVQYYHKFSCSVCKQRFRREEDKTAHLASEHPDFNPIQCPICKKIFKEEASLQIHLMAKHETKDKPFACNKCDKRFTLELTLGRHLGFHKLDKAKPFVCQVCDLRFPNQTRLERHTSIHIKKAHCKICDKSFQDKHGLARHERLHTGEKPFQCDHCEEKFICKATLQWHAAKAHSTPDEHYPCTICGKTFFAACKLKLHLDRHEGKYKRVTCSVCGEKLKSYTALERHNILKHDQDPLICDECGAKLLSKRALRDHKKTHSGGQPHKCDERSLEGHSALNEPLTCQECGAKLNSKDSFRHHKRAHTRGNPHKCDVCDARFVFKSLLRQHMLSHSQETHYVCSQCGKGFKKKLRLDSHVLKLHTHMKKYIPKPPSVCSHCGEAFSRLVHLNNHIRQHHTGERPFICEVCNKGFSAKASLYPHMKTHGISITKKALVPRLKTDNLDTTPFDAPE